MPLSTELHEHVRACFTGLWVLTHEPDEALAEAEARYAEISRAVSQHGAQGGGVQSQTLAGLLADEAALRRQVAVLSKTLGPRHPSLTSVLTEADALVKAINGETVPALIDSGAALVTAENASEFE